MYSTGIAEYPQDSDPRFEELPDAEDAAKIASSDGRVHAVWDDETGEILSLVHEHIVYVP